MQKMGRVTQKQYIVFLEISGICNSLKYSIDFSIGSCEYPQIQQTGSDRLICVLLCSTIRTSSNLMLSEAFGSSEWIFEALLRYFKYVILTAHEQRNHHMEHLMFKQNAHFRCLAVLKISVLNLKFFLKSVSLFFNVHFLYMHD